MALTMVQSCPMPELKVTNPAKPFDTLTEEEIKLTKQPISLAEQEAFDFESHIARVHDYPWYKHLRRFENSRAERILKKYPDKGERLKQFVKQSETQLKGFKVIQFSKIVWGLKPKIIYEFGGGASTALFADLLHQNFLNHGIHGEIHSFEQSPDFFKRISESLPNELKPYVHIHLCPVIYENMGGYRTISYNLPALPNKPIDFAYIDGPAPVLGSKIDYKYPIFSGDIVRLTKQGIFIPTAVNDGRWFNLQFFRNLVGEYYKCKPSVINKSFFITRKDPV